MKRVQKTVTNSEVERYINELIKKKGYKLLSFGEKRVPAGTVERVTIFARRWCGDWSGYQKFEVAVLYK